MGNTLNKLNLFIRDIRFVSKVTGTKNKKLRILVSILLIFLSFSSDIAIIVTIASLFQPTIQSENFLVDFLINNLYLLPLIVVIRQVANYLDVLNSFKLRYEVEENLRVFLLKEVFNKGNYSIGDAYHFLNSFALSVGAFYYSLIAFFASILQLSLYAGYLIFTDINTLLILFIGIVLLYAPTKFFTKRGRRYAHIDWEAAREYNNNLQKILENIFLIKLLKKIEDEITKFRFTLKTYYGAALNNQKVGTLTSSFPQFATFFLLSILLAFFNFTSRLTLDFIGILIRLFQEFSKVNKNIMLVSNNHVVISKLYELIENSTEVHNENFIVDDQIQNAIEVRGLSFKYYNSDDAIFNDISFNIQKGSHIVLTGPNGSGKSTLLGLVSGLIYPQSGKVISHSIKYGYVGVTPLIVTGTIRENLIYGNEGEITDEELLDYLMKFKVFNEETNLDLDKQISIKTLSSGQLQKISFIRSLLNNPDILLLDESTSNLDIDSKNHIFQILETKNMTIINATHNHEDFKNIDFHLKISIANEQRVVSVEPYDKSKN